MRRSHTSRPLPSQRRVPLLCLARDCYRTAEQYAPWCRRHHIYLLFGEPQDGDAYNLAVAEVLDIYEKAPR